MVQDVPRETFFTDARPSEITESQVNEQPREQTLFGTMSEVQPEQKQLGE